LNSSNGSDNDFFCFHDDVESIAYSGCSSLDIQGMFLLLGEKCVLISVVICGKRTWLNLWHCLGT